MKRIFLFFLVNAGVLITISALVQLLGLGRYLGGYGLDLQGLMVLCLIWGMAGSLISLAISRMTAKWLMGVRVIDPDHASGAERALFEAVGELAGRAGLDVLPEVGIYDSDEVNAFATGPSRRRSLVAVSTGLLARMDDDEVIGVLGHEVAHIANGDMVTMTLLQGVINAFVMFFARVIAMFVGQMVRAELRHIVHFAVGLLLEIGLSILGMLVLAWFSRHREYRADAGGAELAGRRNMVSALHALAGHSELVEAEAGGLATLKISSGRGGGWARLFSTHPPLEDRIRRLQNAQRR